ncbi:hypothetical protein BASA50_002708 [Batrachochytrium salamandrivorans]|uniref:Uncharacterized protein n=1 Tax=Batrachochytrium salamandrivorans TaxID=1357716 RepID=A0ABQ8FKU2_9FUNG|nr:hypothetical protein BASA60_004971 [Batrachochytrium salamandrivorans]KAH6592529.1 hypothetical protein BASA61_004526 [Batrachochytrium salamandrivorans]KAH6599879.1 hypothetical protein BASA50_002708 [Batrachochytrium salamandrivorans]KAH9270552.1 hypothetical protein BASA83_007365 [Batrachochytrium salamandrivorans]
MQFFHLFSFVVVASYAAALPQPAELSERHSNNVDANLASGLEARSYQPGLNSQKNSVTLVSLERRDDSEGSSPSTSSPNETFISPFSDLSVSSMNLASTIDQVGNGILDLYKDGEKVGQKIGGDAGDMAATYIRKNTYVGLALSQWTYKSVPGVIDLIEYGLGADEYSEIKPDLLKKIEQLEDKFREGSAAIGKNISRILKGDGSVIDYFQRLHIAVGVAMNSRTTLIWELKNLLASFKAGGTVDRNLDAVIESLLKFIAEQKGLYVDRCILCDQQLLSTSIAHLVVECEQVTGHRIQSGLVPAIQKSRLRLLGRALDPGVENVYTWLRGGVINGEADLDQRWLDGTVEHKSMGTRHDNRALAARLADFLQVAYRQYQSTLWKYHRDCLVEVG